MKKLWSFIKTISPVIGISSLLLAVYINFIIKRSPEVTVEILNKSSLVDIKDKYKKLTILYDSIDLIKNNKELSFIILKIVNTGNIDINLSYLDPNNPFGIRITSGKIIEIPKMTSTSNKYLLEYPKIIQNSDTSFYFQNFLFDHSTFFIIKFLVLHDRNSPIEIETIGKISGTNPIIMSNDQVIKQDQGVFQIIFEGNIWIILLKTIVYSLIGIGVGIVVGIFIAYLNKLLFPKSEPEHKSPGQNLYEMRGKFDEHVINKVSQRLLKDGLEEVERFEYLLKTYQPLGLTELYNELNQKKLKPESKDYLIKTAIDKMIEDFLISYKDGIISYLNNGTISTVNLIKRAKNN